MAPIAQLVEHGLAIDRLLTAGSILELELRRCGLEKNIFRVNSIALKQSAICGGSSCQENCRQRGFFALVWFKWRRVSICMNEGDEIIKYTVNQKIEGMWKMERNENTLPWSSPVVASLKLNEVCWQACSNF